MRAVVHFQSCGSSRLRRHGVTGAAPEPIIASRTPRRDSMAYPPQFRAFALFDDHCRALGMSALLLLQQTSHRAINSYRAWGHIGRRLLVIRQALGPDRTHCILTALMPDVTRYGVGVSAPRGREGGVFESTVLLVRGGALPAPLTSVRSAPSAATLLQGVLLN